MTDITPTAAESADLEARNQSTAGRLFVAADAFLFLGFLFAYLYLRTLNNNDMWNPHGQNPSGTDGRRRARARGRHRGAAARRRGAADVVRAGRVPRTCRRGVVVALVATMLSGSQLFRPGFSPSHAGGFGSVFIGFTAFYFVHLAAASSHLAAPDAAAPDLAVPDKHLGAINIAASAQAPPKPLAPSQPHVRATCGCTTQRNLRCRS